MYYNIMVIEGVHLQLFVPLYYWRQLIIIMKIDLIVFLLLLDASKMFGRIEYVKLFQTLRDRNICPTVLCILWYNNNNNICLKSNIQTSSVDCAPIITLYVFVLYKY